MSQQIDADWESFSEKFPGVDRPEVEVVRVVGIQDWATSVAECMGEQGFTVTVSPDNGLEWETVPAAQAESFALAEFVCSAEYPLNPKINVALDEAQLARLYDYFVDVLAPCLEGEGFTIDQAPSLQGFTDTYYGQGSWSPYDTVVNQPMSAEEWYALNAACPQELDSLYN